MATQTTYYNLTKDDTNEYYNIGRVNANLDSIDLQMKATDTKVGAVDVPTDGDLQTQLNTLRTDLEATITITEQRPLVAITLGYYAAYDTLTSSVKIYPDATRNYAKFNCLAGETYRIKGLQYIFDKVGMSVSGPFNCTTEQTYTCTTDGEMYVNYSASGTYSIVKVVDIAGTANYFMDKIDAINTNLTTENWITASSLSNGWTGSVMYAKTPKTNIVKVKVDLTAGTVSAITSIFTFPTGYRPSQANVVQVVQNDNGSIHNLYINNGGSFVVPFGGTVSTSKNYRASFMYYIE